MSNSMKKSEIFTNQFLNFVEISKENIIKNLNNYLDKEEGFFSEYRKMEYITGQEIQSITYNVSYIVDMGNIFKETISFEIYTNEILDFFIVKEKYTDNRNMFGKKNTKKLAIYISELVFSQIKKYNSPSKLSIK